MISRYRLHPDALRDLEEIGEYIADSSPDAVDGVIAESLRVLAEIRRGRA